MQSRIRPFISTTTANTLFKTMIAPIIDYGDIMWSKGPQSNLKRIQKLQNKACRVILRCRRRTHISTMHSSLGWLTSQNKIKLHKMLMVGKCLLGMYPHISVANLYVTKTFTPTRPEMLTVICLYHVSPAMQVRIFSATKALCFSIL